MHNTTVFESAKTDGSCELML